MLLKSLVDRIIRVFIKKAVQRSLIYLCVIEKVNVVILCVTEIYDRVLECYRALLVGIGNRRTVSAVNLCFDIIFIYVDVLLDVIDRSLFILL